MPCSPTLQPRQHGTGPCGGSLLTGLGLFALIGDASPGALVVLALAAILLGAFFEGVLVGLLQWRVLRGPPARLPRADWVRASALGAGIAWTLGMLPSTILSLTMDASDAPSAEAAFEPSTALILLLAAGMGFVPGAALGTPQWWALRKHVRRAGWWSPANMLAWSVGMALILAGTSFIPGGPIPTWVTGALLGFVLLAGISVGAVHGLFLVRLLQQPGE